MKYKIGCYKVSIKEKTKQGKFNGLVCVFWAVLTDIRNGNKETTIPTETFGGTAHAILRFLEQKTSPKLSKQKVIK